MFHRAFSQRPHLLLLPQPTHEEIDRVDEEHDMLHLYSQVAQALRPVITARPAEISQISDELAALLLAVLRRSSEAQTPDPFGLYPLLHELPRVALQIIYNHFLTDDLHRGGESIEVPPTL
jgi:hypothetical protein